MSREQDNKAIVGRWFEGFWGNPWNPEIIDELAAPGMLLQYSLHAPRRGREDVRNFMEGFRAAFPDLNVALTQTTGWVDAWTAQPSIFAVAAETTGDIVAAVKFARDAKYPLGRSARGLFRPCA